MSLPDIPKSLEEKIKKENIVVFVGAGLSVSAGLPNWKELTISILEGLKDHEGKAEGFVSALKSDLFEPIEVLGKIEHLKVNAIEIFEREIKKSDQVNGTAIHSKIANITSKIVTTNYDELLERSNPLFEKITYHNNYKVAKISEYPKTIFKIHGDIGEPDKCVLFPSQYEELYSQDERSATFELKKIFSDKSILFLGFSLNDPYINYIIDFISKLYSGFVPEHYVVTTDATKKWPGRITPIILEQYSDIEKLIDKLSGLKITSDSPENLKGALDTDKSISIKYASELEYDIPPNVKFWVGRKKEIENISNENFKVIFITGIGGQGKSALAANFVKNHFNSDVYEFGDWRDFKEESNRLQTKLISIIRRLTQGKIEATHLEGSSTNQLIDVFFNYLGSRKIVFVFDNIDSYVDLEQFIPVGGLGYLFNQALNRPHSSRFIFTCRPFIKEASVNFYQISLSGLSFTESLELFRNYKISVSDVVLTEFCRKAHSSTKGHPLWMNLIAAQAIRGIDTANDFLHNIENKTDFNEEDFSSILSQKILNQVWDSLNEKQQTLLRSIAETVKPETISDLKQILDSVINNNQFDKALRTLRNLNLVETKSSAITEDQIELHPLVKGFIVNKYAKKDRVKFITLLVQYYDRYIYILKPKLSPTLSLTKFQNWTSKIELEINKGDFTSALLALEEVSGAILSAGFTEEYVRVAEKLFEAVDWHKAIEEELAYFHNQFSTLINTLTQLGRFQKGEHLLNKYEKLIPGKSVHFLDYLSAMCYLYWYQDKFDDAISYGEQGEFLLSSSGLSDNHSLRHNLALARRDSKEKGQMDLALQFFLGVEKLEGIFFEGRNLASTFYGNVGRCLEFMDIWEIALKCYIKSLEILYDEESVDTKLNTGYASYWISGLLFKRKNTQDGLHFLRAAILSWETISPPNALKANTLWERVICAPETKFQIKSKADWQIEKYCKQKLQELKEFIFLDV